MKKKIGVYICYCGSNISDYVDVEKVRDQISEIEGVALAKTTMFACADSTQKERVEDIPNLVKGFLKKLNSINLKDINNIDPQVLSSLKKYSWPGNIRELENIIERAYILETLTGLAISLNTWCSRVLASVPRGK